MLLEMKFIATRDGQGQLKCTSTENNIFFLISEGRVFYVVDSFINRYFTVSKIINSTTSVK